ncbi:diadenylate cyclase CdaA [Cellulosilyticum sp. I15G10I2]|uniref:diadenylate cyclase CdaA n=1 Tax=Cellulosilyticum sp. I15G10I2 TaxID=1892843 RepID=UPI00085BCA3D|nr:diadenylate cyclase CdaA [Cellulosilyticum sp. I15G10I2]
MEVIKEALDKIAFVNIPYLDIKDVLDILAVAYLMYIVLVWIKDTRTWTLFKGVVIVLVIAILSYVLQLHTLWWVISNTITVGTIAILVVFQPELRRALEQIGRGRVFDSLLVTSDNMIEGMTDETIDAIAKSCVHMSKYKTGALIVIEQDAKLGDVERTGISIDAIITSQLLINIFEKNTPLHDGAIIIKNNRIAAATCFLPLTDSMEISKDLGTRHRAAIGISEVTDAIVLVVSEETGVISYVKNGKIRRGLDMEIIKKILMSTRRKKRSDKKKGIWKGKQKNE